MEGPILLNWRLCRWLAHPSDAVVAERLRQYLFGRLTEATRVLSEDSSRLAEVLIEILKLATGSGKIVGPTNFVELHLNGNPSAEPVY